VSGGTWLPALAQYHPQGREERQCAGGDEGRGEAYWFRVLCWDQCGWEAVHGGRDSVLDEPRAC